MDDSRECFLEYLRIYPRKKFCVDEEPSEWKNSIHKSVLEAIFRTICAYIRHERDTDKDWNMGCLLYTSPSPRDATLSRMPSSA